MRALVLVLMLLVSPAQAEDADDIGAVLDGLSDETHECLPLIRSLNARLAAAPDDLAARLARAECRYRIGRMEWAAEDAQHVFGGRKPAKVEAGLRKVLDAEQASTTTHDGLVLHGVLEALAGRDAAAESAAANLEKTYGATAGHRRVQAVRAWKAGDRARGWALVDAGLTDTPEDPHAKLAATELASLDPDHVSEKAMTLISAPARSNRAYNRAVSALNAGSFRQCLVELDLVIDEQRGPALRRFQMLSYPCAVQAQDLARADAVLASLGAEAVRTDAAIAHAEKLQNAGRDEEAAALLAGVEPRDQADADIVATLLVRIHTRADRLDEALAACRSANPAAATRANLAIKLDKADREPEAREVLAPACSTMSGQDAVRCYDFLKRLGG